MIGGRTDQEPGSAAAPGPDSAVDAIDGRFWVAAIGAGRSDYYLPRFLSFEAGGVRPTWHWPAFFFTFWWFIYRKLWLPALLYWLGWTLVTNVDPLLEAAGLPPILSLLALLLSFTFVPMYANAIYFHALRRKIQRVRAGSLDEDAQLRALERAGGTSFILFLLITLIIAALAAAILIPTYRDYTARAQVGEAVGLTYRFKTDLARHYAEHRTFSGFDGAAPGYGTSGQYVESVRFVERSPAALAVVATFRVDGVQAPLRGREFRIVTLDGGDTWECGGAIREPELRGDNQVDARLLPEQCRQ